MFCIREVGMHTFSALWVPLNIEKTSGRARCIAVLVSFVCLLLLLTGNLHSPFACSLTTLGSTLIRFCMLSRIRRPPKKIMCYGCNTSFAAGLVPVWCDLMWFAALQRCISEKCINHHFFFKATWCAHKHSLLR